MEQHPKQLFSATIVFFGGAENDYEVSISTRKITSKNDFIAKTSTVAKIGSSPIVQPKKSKNRTNNKPKNNLLTSGRNNRSCEGDFPKTRNTPSDLDQHKEKVKFVSPLDKELYPKRKEVSNKFSKERAEELNYEIDEYMREKESGEKLSINIGTPPKK